MSLDLTQELMGEDSFAFASEIDQAVATSGVLPKGKYAARLEGAGQKAVGDKMPWELWFMVTAGPFKGRKVKYQLWLNVRDVDKDNNPLTAEQIAKEKAAVSNEYWHALRVLGVGRRIKGDEAYQRATKQLKSKQQGGMAIDDATIAKLAADARDNGIDVYLPGKRDFRDVLSAECVIETKVKQFKDKSGGDQVGAEIVKFGVHAFDDPKAKGIARPVPGTLPPSSPTAVKEDLSDLAANV